MGIEKYNYNPYELREFIGSGNCYGLQAGTIYKRYMEYVPYCFIRVTIIQEYEIILIEYKNKKNLDSEWKKQRLYRKKIKSS